MKCFKTMGIIILLTAAMSLTTYAQMQPGGQDDEGMGYENPGQPGRGRPLSEKKREEIRKKVEAVRIWRLTEALKLDAATSAKLSSFLSAFDQQRQKIQQDQMETMLSLRLTLKAPKPDEAKLTSLLEREETSRRAMQDIREKEMSGLKNILTTEQQARFLIFHQDFQREMRGMISGVRGRERANAGAARPPDR